MQACQDKIKAVILDFNGTMLFDSHIHRAVWLDFIPAHGGTVETGDLDRRILGCDNAHILRGFFGELTDAEVDRLAYEKEAEYRRRCLLEGDGLRLVNGVEEFLDYLVSENIPHTIATGSDKYNVDFYFEHFSLGKWFERSEVVLDDGSFPGKPSPDIYLIAADKLGVAPRDCLVIEDSHAGVQSARSAGIGRVIGVSTAKTADYYLSAGGVDRLVPDFSDWKSFLS